MLKRIIRNIICYQKLFSFYRYFLYGYVIILRNVSFSISLFFYLSIFCRIIWRISKVSHLEDLLIVQCRAQIGVVQEATEKELREAKFEGVIWHGGYDQSITSSAAQAPHTAPILPGPLPFVRYTSAAAEKTERRWDDEENEEESYDARLQIRLPAMTSPRPVKIERDSTFCISCICA